MYYKNILEVTAGSIVIFLVLMSSAFAQSSYFTLNVEAETVSTCPTIIQGEPPLNKYDIPVYVTNWFEFPDSYTFYLDLPEGWSGFAGLNETVSSGQTKRVDPIWITVPDVEAGSYTVTVSALSGQTGESDMDSLTVEVLSCHDVEVSVDETRKTVCAESVQPAVYTVTIVNNGKGAEVFDLSALDNLGEEVLWASFSDSVITLDSGETEVVTLTLNPPADELEVKEVTIAAKSRSTYADMRRTVSVEVLDCFDYETTLHPSENSVCLGKAVNYTLTLSNPKNADSFTIVTPNWVVAEKEDVSVLGGEVAVIGLAATPQELGELEFDVSVYSEKDPSTVQVLKAKVNSHECRDVAVTVTPEHIDVCAKYPVNYTVFVRNMGTQTDSFDLTSTFGSLETNKVVLQPDQTATVLLQVDPVDTPGEKVIDVVARSGNLSDETTATLTVKNCYSVAVSMDPPEASICPCLGIHYDIALENLGELEDNYTIKFQNRTVEAFLQPGDKQFFNFNFSASCDMEGVYAPTAEVSSDHMVVPKKASANLTVKKLTDCWSLEMIGGDVEMGPDNVYTVPITIRNTGENPTTYELELDGPDWMYLEPENVTLGYGETTEAYIYISPYYGLEFGNYTAVVRAKSLHAISSTRVFVELTPEFMAGNATTETVLIMNATTGITLNASMSETVTEPTGFFIGIVPSWKTITIGVITIIIIIVLVVRFAYLLKV